MTYQLIFPNDQHDIYRELPDHARADVALCLTDALKDPLGHSEPYGEDDGVVRTLARGRVTVVILIGAPTPPDKITGTIMVLLIAYAG